MLSSQKPSKYLLNQGQNNKNTKKGVSIEHVSHLFLVLTLLTLNR